jgi:ribonuclease E
VFDDDLSEEDEETIVRGEDGWGMDSDAQDGEGSEADSEEDSEDEDEEDEDEEDEEEEAEEPQSRAVPSKPSGKTLDPLAALQAGKSKEVMKGRAILRQQVRLRPAVD